MDRGALRNLKHIRAIGGPPTAPDVIWRPPNHSVRIAFLTATESPSKRVLPAASTCLLYFYAEGPFSTLDVLRSFAFIHCA